MRLDHVAVAAWRIDDALAAYRGLGAGPSEIEEVAGQGVRVAFLPLDGSDAHLEILEPLGDKSPIRGFLEKRGPGLHHLAFRVDGIGKKLEQLKASGFQLLSDGPKPGSRGTRVCFIHPRSAGGVLLELVEHP